MPTSTALKLDKLISKTTRQREHHLNRAADFDEELEFLQKKRAQLGPPSAPVEKKEIPKVFRRSDGHPHNIKLMPAQIPEAISLLDSGFTWEEAAARFGIARASLQERVYRYLIERKLLTVDIVQSIWRDASYRYLASQFGPPLAQPVPELHVAA